MSRVLLLVNFMVLSVVNLTNSLNSRHNACKKLEDYPFKGFIERCYENPDVGSTTPAIIQRRGYNVETHLITTTDGYILKMFRIPPKEDDYRKNKQPIFLLHGLLSDSSEWVFVGNRSIGLSLAAEGYDVWLGNERGTRYSRQHKFLKDSDKEFWNYNMDTLAANDIPAFLDRVVTVTGQQGSIIYMGHSRAIMLLFMHCSENPAKVNNILRGIIAFAPTPYLNPSQGELLLFGTAQSLGKSLRKIGIEAIFQYPELIINLSQILCPKFPLVCRIVAGQIVGPTDLLLDDDLLNFFSHFPAPVTVSELIQHGQFYETQEFKKFDFGPNDNLQNYGQEKPPIYNLGKVTLPTYIYYGVNDVYINEKSVQRIFRELGSKRKAVFKVPFGDEDKKHEFAHVDFMFAANLTQLLYEDVKEVLETELS